MIPFRQNGTCRFPTLGNLAILRLVRFTGRRRPAIHSPYYARTHQLSSKSRGNIEKTAAYSRSVKQRFVTSFRHFSFAVQDSSKMNGASSEGSISPKDSSGSASEVPSPPCQAPSATMTSASDPNEDDDDDDDDDFEILAEPFFEFIRTRVINYSKDSPQNSADFSTFKSLWRIRFDRMREELVASQEAELFITRPPLRLLEIEILDDNQDAECPCCLPYAEADIVIRAEGGITREIFLNAVGNYLYGDNVSKGDLALRDVYDGGLLVRCFQYMLYNEGMLYKGSGNTESRIWMYCRGLEKRS